MTLNIAVDGGVATITLNRPASLNAIDTEMRASLRSAWRRVADDDDILVAIITGAGDRAFCVGSDLKESQPAPDSFAATAFASGESDHLLEGLATADKPIICAINGYAVGGGLEIALAADIRIAVPEAQFGLTEARVGSIPGAGGTQLLPRIVGRSMAMHMLLTAELIDGATALRCGLVSELVPRDALLDRAHELAGKITRNAPLSVRAIKRLVRNAETMPLDTGMQVERQVWGLIRDTDDRSEGRDAFREKRPPKYEGR